MPEERDARAGPSEGEGTGLERRVAGGRGPGRGPEDREGARRERKNGGRRRGRGRGAGPRGVGRVRRAGRGMEARCQAGGEVAGGKGKIREERRE